MEKEFVRYYIEVYEKIDNFTSLYIKNINFRNKDVALKEFEKLQEKYNWVGCPYYVEFGEWETGIDYEDFEETYYNHEFHHDYID